MTTKIFILLCAIFLIRLRQIRTDESYSEKHTEWWRNSVIYQIYPMSFKDSNDDGIGDLKGIEEKLDYFTDLGIEILWLSPIFQSPMADMGYDISDFKAIDGIFGTMEDFESLLNKMKARGMKLVLDLVPNHSSDECEWFKKSIDKIDPYTDYYVWKDPKGWNKSNNSQPTPIPPNNWISVFQGSAWEYNDQRKQFYLHDFAVKQPDLNYRSPALVEEMKNVLRFWLDKGVDGFRIDSIMYLYENATFADEPVISNYTINGALDFYSLDHIYTQNQPETYEFAREIRKFIDNYSKKDGSDRLILTEAYTTLSNTMKYYGSSEEPIAQVPFNFELLVNTNYSTNAKVFENTITRWMENMPKGMEPNWVMGNHDNRRMTSRFDPEMIDGLNMLILLLPGITVNYQGDEIGMKDMKIRWDQTKDVQALMVGPSSFAETTREPERTPMQWDSSQHAGFSRINGETWLSVNPNYYQLNVYDQKREPRSHYNVFKKLIQLKKSQVMAKGDFEMNTVDDWIFTFKRSLQDDIFVIVLNLDNKRAHVHLNNTFKLPSRMTVFISSANSEYQQGDDVDTQNLGFVMRPNSALVLHNANKHEPPEKIVGSGKNGAIQLAVVTQSVIIIITIAAILLNY